MRYNLNTMLRVLIIFILFFHFNSYSEEIADETKYSIEKTISAIKTADVDKLTSLTEQKPPSTLYHWISVDSTKRLFNGIQSPLQEMPLKTLGTPTYQSILVSKANALMNRKGLYAWHNPIGGTSGGSNEIYGNNEALIAMKISPQARVGKIITVNGVDVSSKINDFDLLLHINGGVYNSEFGSDYIEWVILNPKIVEEITMDKNILNKSIQSYIDVVEETKKRFPDKDISLASDLFGPQHQDFAPASVERLKKLQQRLETYNGQLPDWLRSGWVPIKSKQLKAVPTSKCLKKILSSSVAK